MSVAVRSVSTSILSSNIKEDQAHKNGNSDDLNSCEFKEQLMNVDGIINGKDLAEETTKKPASDHDEADAANDNDSLKSSSELSVVSSNEQLDKNKDDQSLSTSKQQVLGSINLSPVSESKEVEVKILRMCILSPGRADVVMPIPFPTTTSKATLFTLKEGSKYRTIFHFTVSNNTVNALCYSYMVWKAGVRVCNTKKMMGKFSPHEEPYTLELEEGTTPTGFFARGPFLVRSKFTDDDGKVYLDTTYYFDIRKDWGATDKC